MTSLFSRLAGLRNRHESKVAHDADRLIRLWGSTAFDRATDLSSQEDLGFISTDRPGHWWSVRAEIGSRTGRRIREPALGVTQAA